MAGFFGLLDYNKPGKGVEKGGPQKQPFFVFFEVLFRKFWKLVLLNLIYCLFWMPIPIVGLLLTLYAFPQPQPLFFLGSLALTLLISGPITCGLTYVTRNFARQEHAFVWHDFIGATRANWKQGLAASVINGLVYGILGFAAYFYVLNKDNTNFQAIFYLAIVVSIIALLIFTFMQYYIYLSIVSCKLTIKKTYQNAFRLALAGVPRNLLISIIVVPCVIVLALLAVDYQPLLFFAFPISLIFTFAFGSFFINFVAYPFFQKNVIDPYYREHPDQISDTMRTWGYLEQEEEEEEDEEETDEEVQTAPSEPIGKPDPSKS